MCLYARNIASIVTRVCLLAIVTLALVSCDSQSSTPSNSLQESPTSTPPATQTPRPPTPTAVPLAARVNGIEITLEEYQAELQRFQSASGTEMATQDEAKVLDDLIDQELFAQAAIQAGFTLDETALQQRIDQLIEQLGGQQALEQWMSANYYTDQSFRLAFARELKAAWMRDQIVTDVPTQAPQLHVRQILLYDQISADNVYAQLQAGADFNTLVAQYDAVTYGDIGWFPRGYLLDQELEEVAFSLQPGEYSPVIQTSAGYHIILVIESDSERLLEPDALWTLQQQALAEWIQEQRSISQIEIMLP